MYNSDDYRPRDFPHLRRFYDEAGISECDPAARLSYISRHVEVHARDQQEVQRAEQTGLVALLHLMEELFVQKHRVAIINAAARQEIE